MTRLDLGLIVICGLLALAYMAAILLREDQAAETVYLCADGEPFMTVTTEAHEAFRSATAINFGGIDLEVCE